MQSHHPYSRQLPTTVACLVACLAACLVFSLFGGCAPKPDASEGGGPAGRGAVSVSPVEVARSPATSNTHVPSVGAATGVAPDAPVSAADGSALDRWLRDNTADYWFGVYAMGRKVGHAHMVMRTSTPAEPGRWMMSMDMEMGASGGGNAMRMKVRETRYYAGAAPHGLVHSDFVSESSGLKDVRALTVRDGKMVLSRSLNGEVQPQRERPLTAETMEAMLASMPVVSKETLRVGAKLSFAQWNWQYEADDETSTTVLRHETQSRAGVSVVVAVMEASLKKSGLKMEIRSTLEGVPLLIKVGAMISMKLEDRTVATSGVTGLDIMGTAVPVERDLGRPEGIDTLSLKVTSRGDLPIPSAPNQRVEARPGKVYIVRLRRGPGAAVTDEERRGALSADAIHDSEHSTIVAKAKSLTDGLTTDRAKVKAMAAFVYQHLDKRLATHVPTSSAVLAQGVGDCTEHTWLFVGLCRAAGIPARPAYGLGYTQLEGGIFAYHAWPEVALDGHWQPVDPTWNELEAADATHLKLGNDLISTGGLMGGISIEVID